jgi:dCMP deaminase
VSARPGWDAYYIEIARAVAARSSCVRRRVGAIIVVNRAIISTGYNGTPIGAPNCDDGGCARCAGDAPSGGGYDTCLCVHAEQNAVALAARHGTATDGGWLYCTLRPCFSCVKEIVQSGIRGVVYQDPFPYPAELEAQFDQLVRAARLELRRA